MILIFGEGLLHMAPEEGAMKKYVRGLLLFSLWFFITERGVAIAQSQKVRVAWVAVGGAMAPVWIAYDLNLYKRYGLNAELVYVGGSTLATRALLAGDLDITMNSGL